MQETNLGQWKTGIRVWYPSLGNWNKETSRPADSRKIASHTHAEKKQYFNIQGKPATMMQHPAGLCTSCTVPNPHCIGCKQFSFCFPTATRTHYRILPVRYNCVPGLRRFGPSMINNNTVLTVEPQYNNFLKTCQNPNLDIRHWCEYECTTYSKPYSVRISTYIYIY